MECSPRIAIVGSGNVASHLAIALDRVSRVEQVLSRNINHAKELAVQLKSCRPISDAQDFDSSVDFCIIAVNDDAIGDVAKSLPRLKGGIAAHTSGSVPMSILSPLSEKIGVFYPLQTFSKNAVVLVEDVPFFIEASDSLTLQSLDYLASKISRRVSHADSTQRAILHIAAVFACNFANHLWAISDRILCEYGIPFTVFEPLLKATLDKALSMPPAQAQTGPAKRGDTVVMKKHMEKLPPDERDIYKLLSDSIMKTIQPANDRR